MTERVNCAHTTRCRTVPELASVTNARRATRPMRSVHCVHRARRVNSRPTARRASRAIPEVSRRNRERASANHVQWATETRSSIRRVVQHAPRVRARTLARHADRACRATCRRPEDHAHRVQREVVWSDRRIRATSARPVPARSKEVCASNARRTLSPSPEASVFHAHRATKRRPTRASAFDAHRASSRRMASCARCAPMATSPPTPEPTTVCHAPPVAHPTLRTPNACCARRASARSKAVNAPSACRARRLDREACASRVHREPETPRRCWASARRARRATARSWAARAPSAQWATIPTVEASAAHVRWVGAR
jgi:hypothetical protein